MRPLYPQGIKRANKLPASDLRQIAHFNKIIKNYLKMCELEKKIHQ